MQTLLLFLLSLLFSLIGLVPVMAQTPVVDYLQANHAPFAPSGWANIALFDSAFYTNDVFMLGENHGYAVPQTLDLTLLKHLNQRVGLRYYLAEMDVAQAELVNQYLTTGNTFLLDSLFRGFLMQTMAGTLAVGQSAILRQDYGDSRLQPNPPRLATDSVSGCRLVFKQEPLHT